MTVAACIPTMGAATQLWALLDVLAEDGIRTIVHDNGVAPDQRQALDIRAARRELHVVDAHHMSLHAMWNDAARHATGADAIAFLNDDIAVLPGTMDALAAALQSDPGVWLVSGDYRRPTSQGIDPGGLALVSGTYRQNGVCGWCYMVRADRWPGVDEQFEVWYGDDDIVASIQAAGGKVAIACGIPVDHQGEATIASLDWTHDAKVRDAHRYSAKWAHR